MAVWPVSLPQSVIVGFTKLGAENQFITSSMASGPPKRRKRFSGRVDKYEVRLIITKAQLATLETFYYTTNGVDAFDWKLPESPAGSTVSMKFATERGLAATNQSPSTGPNSGYYEVVFVLERGPY